MPHGSQSAARPATIAIVGRPNVGKSTLFNRLIGRRRAIVTDEPGITRDRLYGEGHWAGRSFRVVDTGGIVPQDKEAIPAEIFRQARMALEQADAIVMVVDGRSELASPDLELSRLLMRTGKRLFLAVNKIDTIKLEPEAENFRRLGIGNVFPISAEHGKGVDDLLDAVLEDFPRTESASGAEQRAAAAAGEAPLAQGDTSTRSEETKIAIIGRPNVGKSTLLNQLIGSPRAIVSPIPGTTRDAVDELVEREGAGYRFIDTAGIRRKGRTKLVAEKLSVVMARKHLESADIALLVIDATEGVTALDANIAGYAHESGRSVVIVVNKWDLVAKPRDEKARRATVRPHSVAFHAEKSHRQFPGWGGNGQRLADRGRYEQEVRRSLKFLDYAPVVFVSATTGQNIGKIFELVTTVAGERRKRIPTSAMNRFLASIDFERAPVPASRRVKIYYMTQVAVAPPTFILFTDRAVKLHFSYERFLENQIRRAFGFVGTPIWIKVRART